MEQIRKITDEVINTFLNGHNPAERIVNLEYSYRDDFITVYSRTAHDEKKITRDPFYPFVWANKDVCVKMKKKAEELASSYDDFGNRKLYYYEYEIAKKPGTNETKLDKEGKPIRYRKKIYASSMSDLMSKYGISVKKLRTTDNDGKQIDAMERGYTMLFKATKAMSYSTFLDFFKLLGQPVYSDNKDADDSRKEKKNYFAATPQEQYLIYTGKRFFKGYDDYDDVLRMIFDLETTGLDTDNDRIEQIGIRFNRPFIYKGKEITFERIIDITGDTEEEKNNNELEGIRTAFKIIAAFEPDIITAHNGETFDWNMFIGALKRLGTSIEEESKKFFNGRAIYKSQKENSLKLGGEVEKFFPTIVPGTIVTDSLHAVRRAQAVDSNFAEGSLKYSIKYLNLQKENRVYIPGDKITSVWNDNEKRYLLNDTNGDWYIYDRNCDKKYNFDGQTKRNYIPIFNEVKNGYEFVTGKYIGQRYLLDDLWECDKVELALNQSAFNICKNLPLTFQKCCTMGTAGQWKSLMTAWSFENDLAIPFAEDTGKFTGGLSRLLCVGASGPGLVKFDFNSLYPSIVLTWAIEDEKDISGVTLLFLLYFLNSREEYKNAKKAANKIIEKYEEKISSGLKLTESEEAEYAKALTDFSISDKLQSVRKVFCNSFFGAYGSNRGSVYPWKSVKCAERTTCTGRQMLRLMISFFKRLGYQPIVGDSVTGDTPLIIKYKKNGFIDIVPIEELIDIRFTKIDMFGREYDLSEKDYYVLCRSGWMEPNYIYRHKTNKKIYTVKDGDVLVEVTEDHSLYNSDKKEVKPSEIDNLTKLEYFNDLNMLKNGVFNNLNNKDINDLSYKLAIGQIDRVPLVILNSSKQIMENFYVNFIKNSSDSIEYSKVCLAGIYFLKKCIISNG